MVKLLVAQILANSLLVFAGFLVKNYSKERFKGQLRVNFCRRAAGTPILVS
jgi:hypothetical protein